MSEILNVARLIVKNNAEVEQTRLLEEQKRQEQLKPYKVIGVERAVEFVELMLGNKIPTEEFINLSRLLGGSGDKESIVHGWSIQDYIEYGRGEQPGYAVLEDSSVIEWDGWSGRRSIRARKGDVSEVLHGDGGLDILGNAVVKFGIVK